MQMENLGKLQHFPCIGMIMEGGEGPYFKHWSGGQKRTIIVNR